MKMLMHEHVQLFRYPEVSQRDQSRWPSNCTGFHGHHVMRKESIAVCLTLILSKTSALMLWDVHCD